MDTNWHPKMICSIVYQRSTTLYRWCISIRKNESMFFGTYIISHSVVRNIKYDDIDLKNASDEEKYAYVPYDLI